MCDLSGKSGILKCMACSNQVTKLKQKKVSIGTEWMKSMEAFYKNSMILHQLAEVSQ